MRILGAKYDLRMERCPRINLPENPGDTRIISVCVVSIANDGGAGGDKRISRGTESKKNHGDTGLV